MIPAPGGGWGGAPGPGREGGGGRAGSARALAAVERIRRTHRLWLRVQGLLGAVPVFALVNKIRPIFADGSGHDMLPSLLPAALERHYDAELAACLAALALSEILRRRYHARHRDELDL